MDSASTPLADYFWIAGVEATTYNDPLPSPTTNQLENTITEDAEADEREEVAASHAGGAGARAMARHSRHSSINRLSKISGLSADGRLSFMALEELDIGTRSNRSSTTIRPGQLNGAGGAGGPGGAGGGQQQPGSIEGGGAFSQDFDFDKALVKFAAERENFLDELTFSAGAKLQSRPPMVNQRAERLKASEGEQSGRMSPLRSIKGSIRRRVGFRELSSVRKQPTAPKPGRTWPLSLLPRRRTTILRR